MKKRVLSLLLCIMLVVGMMPTTAFAGVTDTWDVDLIVSKNTALQYNGQDTVEIGFGVQSDNLKLMNAQTICFAVDLNVFDFIYDNSGTAEDYTSLFTETLSSEDYSSVVYKKYSSGSGLSAIKWDAKVYFAKKSNTGYMILLPNCGKETPCTEQIVLASLLLGFKAGKSIDDLTSTSIRLINKTEVAALNQSSAVMITDGNANTQNAILADGGTDTLKVQPKIVWDGITPAKPAYPGTIAAPKVKTNAGGTVELNAVTPTAGGDVQYGYSDSASTPPTDWQDSTIFESMAIGETLYFYAKVVETDDYQELVSDATAVTVAAKPAASVTAPTARTDLTYNGSEQPLLSYRGTATNGTMQYSLNGTDWTDTDPTGKNAGDYTVYYMVKGDSTHSDYTPTSNTVTVKIDPKGIYDSTVTIDPIPNQTYTGNAIEPPLVVKDGGTVLKKDKDYTVSYPINNTNAGLASLQVNGMGNYTGTKGESFNIDRADQKLTVPGSVEVPFGTTKDLKTVCSSNAPGVTLQFALAPGASMPSGTSFDAANGTVTAGNNTGAFDVTVNSAAVTNYNAALQKTITVKIVAKTPSVYTEEPAPNTGLKYDGSEQLLVTAGTTNHGTVKYSLDGSTWTDTVPTGKNAGDYTVHYKIVGDAAHSDSTPKTHTVTIAPREVTVAAGDYKVSKKYDGTTTAGTGNGALSVTGIADSGVSVKATPVAYTSPDVGGQPTMDVAITLDGTGKGNYKIKDGATTISVPCEITPATLTVTPNAGQSKKFGAEDPTLHSTTSGKVSSQIPDYTGALGRAEGEAVGQYDITLGTLALIDHFSSGFKASNYELKMASPAVKFEITKADAPTLEDITVNQKYTVTTGEKAIGAVMPDDAGTLTYAKGTTESKTGSVTIDSWAVDASTGKVTYTLSGGKENDTVTLPVIIKSTNYADSTVNVVIKLIKGSSGGYYYAPTAAVVPDMPMLYRGCTGDAVKTLQDKLNALGYNSGSVDGIFGAKTYAAVTAFQKANSLGVDGIVGKLTWGKLYGVSPAMPVETTTVVGRPTVSYGSRGDAVRKLQELLNALGYDCGSVDGIFGSKTKAAVLAFQKANGLGVDGIVGPLTWAKLG